MVKNVPAVPSGPTKLNGPVDELLAAIWNFTEVFAGMVAFQLKLPQIGVMPPDGLASLSDETRLPAETNRAMKTRNPASVVCVAVRGFDQTVPLVAPVTRVPPG